MKIKRVFYEEEVAGHEITRRLIERYRSLNPRAIDKIENVFGVSKKPYLDKRHSLNLFIGRKKGTLLKEAPPAYGTSRGRHYYFIYAYNCVYECQYCYLQGYFDSPDLVIFVNHDEILQEMTALVEKNTADKIEETWFHAGEFSDSLALSHLTNEWQYYWPFFSKYPQAYLELRTKSANIESIINLPPYPNIVVSYSLSPEKQSRAFDLKAPPLAARLRAIKKLAAAGFTIGIHFDPVIDSETLAIDYEKLVDQLLEVLPEGQLDYLSLGVVRFTRDVYQAVKTHYPDSAMLAAEFVSSFDNKIRYHRPVRLYILNTIKNICQAKGISEDKIYLCMEETTQ